MKDSGVIDRGTRSDHPRPAGRKLMIVEAARRLAVKGGLAAVSMEDIASELNVTAGALYRHYPGKAAIAEAVSADTVQRFLSVANAARRATLDEKTRPDHRLAQIVSAVVTFSLDDPSLLRVHTRQWGAEEAVSGAQHEMADMWSEEIRAAVPGITSHQLHIRHAAAIAALADTSRDGPVSRPALDALLSCALASVLTSPLVTEQHAVREPRTTPHTDWTAPPTRRDEILTAALSLFRVNGFAGTTVDDIGRALGLSGSGIYRSYESKADILLDAYDRAAAHVIVGIEEALASASGPLDALRRLALAYAGVAIDNADLIVVTGREGSALPEQDAPRLGRRARGIRDSWVPILRQVDTEMSEAQARVLYRGTMALVNGAVFAGEADIGVQELAGLMLAFLMIAPQPQTELLTSQTGE